MVRLISLEIHVFSFSAIPHLYQQVVCELKTEIHYFRSSPFNIRLTELTTNAYENTISHCKNIVEVSGLVLVLVDTNSATTTSFLAWGHDKKNTYQKHRPLVFTLSWLFIFEMKKCIRHSKTCMNWKLWKLLNNIINISFSLCVFFIMSWCFYPMIHAMWAQVIGSFHITSCIIIITVLSKP